MRPALLLLVLSVLVGAWLRFSGLDARSISHPEMYVPGIRLPEGISEPAERLTVARILTGTFSSDTHPPGYYLALLPWTRVMGASLRAIRFPSALLGLACIPLLYCMGVLAGRPLAGALASLLLALSGYHVFWSQVARMFALACFLGLAASVLLLWIARGARHSRVFTCAYALLILAGLATHVYFWSLFLTHLIWTFGNAWGRKELPGICRAQLAALVVGSPLIAFAAYQNANTVAILSNNALRFFAEFIPFAFVLPSSLSGFFPGEVPFTGTALSWALRGITFLVATLLLWRGLREALWRDRPMAGPDLNGPSMPPSLWRLTWVASALLGTLQIAAFLYLAHRLPPDQLHSTLRIAQLLSVLPFALMIVALLADRFWARLPAPPRWLRWISGNQALLALLSIAPFALLAGLAQIRPILNQRGLLFAAPYLLLILSLGLVSLRRKALVAGALAVVAVAYAASLSSYRAMTVDPADYGQFATAIRSEIQAGDLVFLRKAWYTTPILYYLPAGRYRVVGRNYTQARTVDPAARVWVVLLYDSEPAPEIQQALTGYRPRRTIIGSHAKAILYDVPTFGKF